MLMHCRGTLIMTPRGYMVLTGKRALEVSGSVAAESNEAIGGLEIMSGNGECNTPRPTSRAPTNCCCGITSTRTWRPANARRAAARPPIR